jgi:Tfp pilus assembly protein PilV
MVPTNMETRWQDAFMEQRMGNRGFSLIEFCIALFVATFVLLSLITASGLIMNSTRHDKDFTTASNVLQDKMETFRQMKMVNIVNGSDSIVKNNMTFNRNWTCSTSGNLKTITMTVTWGIGKSLNSSIVLAQ